MSVLDRRLLIVTGKGGVGRTTTTALLGLAAARAGRRTCLVELHGSTDLARAVGRERATYAPQPVVPGLDVMSLTTGECMADFGRRKLHIGPLSKWIFEARLMTGFVESVPGLQDLVQLGKVENLLMEPLSPAERYDLLVVDAPATGHGLTLLASARSMREMTRMGPFHDLAALIDDLISSPTNTGLVITTLPERLPIHETLELAAALTADGTPPVTVLVNRVRRSPLPDGQDPGEVRDRILAAAETAGPYRPGLVALASVAADADAALDTQDAQLAELPERLNQAAHQVVPVAHIPRLDRSPDLAALEALAATLLDGDP